MSNHGTDERGWPLVPIDPAAIPEGYEAMRVGWPIAGEWTVMGNPSAHRWSCDSSAKEFLPYVIIRPIPKPIRLPTSIVPNGWWVAKDQSGNVWCYKYRPDISGLNWTVVGACEKLPSWIAAQLPQEWHALPWDQSAVQQQEGGEG